MARVDEAGDTGNVAIAAASQGARVAYASALGDDPYGRMLRVRRSGVLSRHRHPQPVHGYVIKGRWRYLEHDWVATEGACVYEAPGETHTLVVDPDVDEMITLFQVNGAMIYVDPDGRCTGYDEVFTRIDRGRRHDAAVGLGADDVERFLR